MVEVPSGILKMAKKAIRIWKNHIIIKLLTELFHSKSVDVQFLPFQFDQKCVIILKNQQTQGSVSTVYYDNL